MIHKNIFSRILNFEFNHHCAACRDKCGLHVLDWWTDQIAFTIDTIEYFTDHMEIGNKIDAAIPDIDPNRIADLGIHIIHERTSFSVEDNILWLTIQISLCIKK